MNNLNSELNNENEIKVNKDDIVYYARIMPRLGVFDICELKVRSVYDTHFVGMDKRDKKCYPFDYKNIDKIVFLNRNKALQKVRESENKNRIQVSKKTYYEEY